MLPISPNDIHALDASRSLPRLRSRIAMLECVEQNIGQGLVPRELHAFCHICPLDAPAVTELRKLSKDDLVRWGKICREAANEWCTSSWGNEVNNDFSTQAKSGDESCATTKQSNGICRITRILPLALCQQTPGYSLWEVLDMFWGKQRKDRLFDLVSNITRKKSLLPKTSINSACNLSLLSPDAQTCWIRGDLILEPVDPSEIFNSCALDARVLSIIQHSSHPRSTRINAQPGVFEPPKKNHDIQKYNHQTDLPIKDNDIIAFKTDCPISMPLPDQDLLELHGFMMQVLRLAGRMPWALNQEHFTSGVPNDAIRERNDRLADRGHGLGYTLEAELEDYFAASGYSGSEVSSFPSNVSAESIEAVRLRKWKRVSRTHGIWIRMWSFLRTRGLRNK